MSTEAEFRRRTIPPAKHDPIKVEVVHDRLVISIGVATLCQAVLTSEHSPEDEGPRIIKDERAFARAIAKELQRDAEGRDTVMQQMLDYAAERAIEGGA